MCHPPLITAEGGRKNYHYQYNGKGEAQGMPGAVYFISSIRVSWFKKRVSSRIMWLGFLMNNYSPPGG